MSGRQTTMAIRADSRPVEVVLDPGTWSLIDIGTWREVK
jgi:hypothetical protein